jgi:hypothetical protein
MDWDRLTVPLFAFGAALVVVLAAIVVFRG